MSTNAPGSVILVRLYVGLIFIIEGMLKYARPEQLGVGRFAKVGIPAAASLANLDGAFEIGCGPADRARPGPATGGDADDRRHARCVGNHEVSAPVGFGRAVSG
jgi:hypothetical protein